MMNILSAKLALNFVAPNGNYIKSVTKPHRAKNSLRAGAFHFTLISGSLDLSELVFQSTAFILRIWAAWDRIYNSNHFAEIDGVFWTPRIAESVLHGKRRVYFQRAHRELFLHSEGSLSGVSSPSTHDPHLTLERQRVCVRALGDIFHERARVNL